MQWAGHAACIEENRDSYKILIGNTRERDNLGDRDANKRFKDQKPIRQRARNVIMSRKVKAKKKKR